MKEVKFGLVHVAASSLGKNVEMIDKFVVFNKLSINKAMLAVTNLGLKAAIQIWPDWKI